MAQHGFLLAVGVKTITVLSYWSPKTAFFSLLCCRFTKQSVTNSIGYFEETVPAYFGYEFASHFQLSRNTCELLTTEIVASGHINLGNEFGRAPIAPQKQVLVYLWMMANACETTRQVADRFNVTMSSCGRILRSLWSPRQQ